jgi:hypothetical protein
VAVQTCVNDQSFKEIVSALKPKEKAPGFNICDFFGKAIDYVNNEETHETVITDKSQDLFDKIRSTKKIED